MTDGRGSRARPGIYLLLFALLVIKVHLQLLPSQQGGSTQTPDRGSCKTCAQQSHLLVQVQNVLLQLQSSSYEHKDALNKLQNKLKELTKHMQGTDQQLATNITSVSKGMKSQLFDLFGRVSDCCKTVGNLTLDVKAAHSLLTTQQVQLQTQAKSIANHNKLDQDLKVKMADLEKKLGSKINYLELTLQKQFAKVQSLTTENLVIKQKLEKAVALVMSDKGNVTLRTPISIFSAFFMVTWIVN